MANYTTYSDDYIPRLWTDTGYNTGGIAPTTGVVLALGLVRFHIILDGTTCTYYDGKNVFVDHLILLYATKKTKYHSTTYRHQWVYLILKTFVK